MTDANCPYKKIINNFSFFGGKKTADSSSKCPFTDKPIVETKTEEKNDEKKKDDKKEEVSSDEDDKNKNQGGCPVLNKSISVLIL